SAYVVGSVVLTRLLGAALATTFVIAAQVLTALALDHFRALGLPRRRMNRTRTLAALLVLAALALIISWVLTVRAFEWVLGRLGG
ncbi:MAG: DMT family transporter, partial [Rhizomicrobium sp.]